MPGKKVPKKVVPKKVVPKIAPVFHKKKVAIKPNYGICPPNYKKGKTNCVVCPDPKTINPATGKCIGVPKAIVFGPANKHGKKSKSEINAIPIHLLKSFGPSNYIPTGDLISI